MVYFFTPFTVQCGWMGKQPSTNMYMQGPRLHLLWLHLLLGPLDSVMNWGKKPTIMFGKFPWAKFGRNA